MANINFHVQTSAALISDNSSHERDICNGGNPEEPDQSVNGCNGSNLETRMEQEIVKLSEDDLQLFEHQVSGHGTAEKGLLKHKHGYVLKPLQGPPKGTREVNFYRQIFSSSVSKEDCYIKLQQFVPGFHGIASLQRRNSTDIHNGSTEAPVIPEDTGNRYLMMDDVLRDYKKPCVVDLKLGPQTWSPDASEAKIKQEMSKYKKIKFPLGICLTGMIYYDAHKGFEKVKGKKEFLKSLDPPALKQTLKNFFNHEKDSQTSSLSSILLKLVQEKLQKIEEVFSTQTSFRLYGSSVLVAYDADFFDLSAYKKLDEINSDTVPLRVFMIDFAHFHPGNYDCVDDNYLFGLRNLLKLVCDIMENK